MQKQKPIIGWREYVALPDLDISSIKVKVDSGARTSALHAENLEFYKKGRNEYVKCAVYPLQRSKKTKVIVHLPVLEKRWIKSSVGHKTFRPVILTNLKIGEFEHKIELTLVNRDIMGFRMLLGREAIRKRYLLDAGKSFLIGPKPSKKVKKKKPALKK